MTSRNDITGDSIATKKATDSYRDGWERIFGKKPVTKDEEKVTVIDPKTNKDKLKDSDAKR